MSKKGRAGNSKSKEKGKGETGIAKVVRFAEELRKEYVAFRTEWKDKFNNLSERFEKIVMAVGQQMAGLNANQQIHGNVIERLDINIQAVDRNVREVFGRFEQIDVFLQKAGIKFDDLTQEELAAIKDEAHKTYEDTSKESFRQVREERKAAIEENRKRAVEAQRKAAEEAVEKKEAEAAEQELQNAEQPPMLAEPPSEQGAKIPSGADVFGGDDDAEKADSNHRDQSSQAG